eukprot:EG_transcript_20285
MVGPLWTRTPGEKGPSLKVGPTAVHTGKPFPCAKLTVHVQLRHQKASVDLHYEFENTFREAELYFPIGELRAFSDFHWQLNGEPCVGQLEEVPPEGDPVRYPLGAGPDLTEDSPSLFYYYWAGPQLQDLEPSTTTALDVTFTCALLEETGRQSFLLPMSVLPIAPQSITMDVRMRDPIRHIGCVNLPYDCGAQIQQNIAQVVVLQPETLSLEDHLLVVTVEFGTPPNARGHDSLFMLLIMLTGFSLVSYLILAHDLP